MKFIKLFHYKPHHLGLSSKQRNYFCNWKNQLNLRQKSMNTSYSYILLYCYEIVNDLILSNSHERFNALVFLYEEYLIKYPVLKERIFEWIVEYGLKHHIPGKIVSSFFEQNLTYLDVEANKEYLKNMINNDGSQMSHISDKITSNPLGVRKFLIPIGETSIGRKGKKYLELSKGQKKATP